MELETQMLSRQVQSWVFRGPGLSDRAQVLWLSAPRVCLSWEGGRLPSDYSERLLFTQQLYSKLTCAIIGVFLILTIITGHFLSSFLKHKWLFNTSSLT